MARSSPANSRRMLSVVTLALMISPAVLIGIAPAALADSGFQVVTDPAGDNVSGAGAASDLVRLGVSTDANYFHFYFKVNSAGTPPAPTKNVFFNAYFTVPGTPARNWVAWVKMAATTGALSSPRFDTNGGDTCASQNYGGVATAGWNGNELVIDVARSSVGSPADGTVLTGVYAQTFQCTVPSETVFDRAPNSGTTTYTVGQNGVVTPTVPSAPATFAATAGDGKATLAWTAPSSDGNAAITSYQVSRGTTSGSLSPLTAGGCSGLGNVLTCVDTGLTNGQTYYYTVAATNSAGTGPASSEASVTPATSPPPPPPASLSFTTYAGPTSGGGTVFNTGADNGGEPSIGVNWKTGNVMVTGTWFSNTQTFWRITFDETKTPPTATWTAVPAAKGLTGTIDAILFTDSENGRTWAGGILHGCSILYFTDDDGATWIPTFENCALPSVDHETIGAWKYHAGATNTSNPVYSKAFYYCVQGDAVTVQPGLAQCAMSPDGGLTYGPGVYLPCGYLHGHIRGGPDGSVYLPFKDCAATQVGRNVIGSVPGQAIVYSRDNGATWTASKLPTVTTGVFGETNDPQVAVGRGDKIQGGRVYAVAQDGATHHPFAFTSDDGGVSWKNTIDLSTVGAAAGLKAATFMQVYAGDDDRAVIAFEGTKDGSNSWYHSASNSGVCGTDNIVWHHYMGMTYDGGVTWTIVDTTPTDPIQRGAIWQSGGGDGCRNLLDFTEITMDATGRPISVYADGCITPKCIGPTGTVTDSRNALVTVARLTTGRGLLAQYDTGGPAALSVSTTGPYSGKIGNAISVAATATGGTAPYTFTWSVVNAPVGSATAAFNNPNAAVTSFTPDVPGAYTLRVTAADAGTGLATADVTLVAALPATPGCQPGGVTIADDSTSDALNSDGDATEAWCLRARDDPDTLDFYFDVKGQSFASSVSPIYYDLYLSTSAAGGQPPVAPVLKNEHILIEATWDGTELTAGAFTPNFVPILEGFTLSAEWEDENTIHISWARTDATAPRDGDILTGMYLDVNSCVGSPSCTFKHYDYVPATKDGAYTVGAIDLGVGGHIPLCFGTVATDPAGDVTPGIRDLTRFSMSDTDDTVTFCWTVSNYAEAAETYYHAFFAAPYAGPGIAYSANVHVLADGTIDAEGSGLQQGACDPLGDCGTFISFNGTATRTGNVVKLTVLKSDLGSPADADQITGISVSSRDQNDDFQAEADRLSGDHFTFGMRYNDVTPPTTVTGLAVADPQTGDSLVLTWDEATDDAGVVKYNVFRADAPNGAFTLVGTPTGAAFTDTGLTTNAAYSYKVNAEDAAGNVGGESTIVTGMPTPAPDTTPPSVPTNLVACGASTFSACVAWTTSTDAESGVAHYRVFRDGAFLATTTQTSYADTTVDPSTTYTYAVSAVNTVGLESARSDGVAITTLGFSGPEVHVTTPAEGASAQAPLTISGTYSTTGQPMTASGHDLEDALPWETREWLESAFVQTALRSGELTDTQSELSTLAGYLGSYPTSDGQIQVMLSGAKPATAPTSTARSHWPIAYAENVAAKPLVTPIQLGGAELFTVDDIRSGRLQAAPGMIAPGTEAGIGPGTAIQMHMAQDAATAGYVCTASFLFQDPNDPEQYYLQTAGHCLLDTGRAATDFAQGPSLRADQVRLCFQNCVNNYVSGGRYIVLSRTATYDPIAWAHQNGVGDDAGFIRIPKDVNPFLRPWMNFWTGPTGVPAAAPARGDALVHYGHGVGSGAVLATRARAAVGLGGLINANANSFEAAGYIWNGDSGSSIGFAQVAPGSLVTGGPAAGIVTHATGTSTPVGFPGNNFYGTTFKRALDMAQPSLGFRPVLVTQDATIRTLPTEASVTLDSKITTPATATQIPHESDLVVSGTATYPVAVTPGTSAIQYYLHGSACAGAEAESLQTTPAATSSGCGSLAHPVGPAWEATLGPLWDIYPANPAPTTDTYLDNSRPINGRIYFGCYRGASQNPSCVPNGVNDIEIMLVFGDRGGYGGTMVGSTRIQNTLVFGATPTPVDFSFTGTVGKIPVGKTPTLIVEIHQAGGPLYIYSGGSTASYVQLPLGTVAPAGVELFVDTMDAAHQVAVSGTTSWTATVPAALLPDGAHTILARATQGATTESTPASIQVTVQPIPHVAPTASFTLALAGATVSVTDTSTPGDSAIVSQQWTWGDGSAAATGATARHTYGAEGSYTVTLLVTDENGLTSTATQTLDAPATWTIDLSILDAVTNSVVATGDAGVVDAGDGTWSYFLDQQLAPGTYVIDAHLNKDGATAAQTSSTFTVPDLNLAPVIDPIAAQVVQQGDTLSFAVSGTDPDAGPGALTWSLGAAPAGVTLDANTMTVTWPTTFNDLGAYAIEIRANDGRATTTTSVPVTVLLTARAPSVAAVAQQTVVELSTLTTWVHATTLNHDVVTLTASDLPAGAVFTDYANNTGKLVWTPGIGAKGNYAPTVTATSYGLTATTTVPIRVLQKASLTLTPVGSTNQQGSPGQVLTLTANITNTGPSTDTFHFVATNPNGWTTTAPADVTLAPGATTTVTFSVTIPQNGVSATVTLKATSDGNPNVFRTTSWFASVPTRVVVHVDNATVGGRVTGTVTVTFLDGTAVQNATVALTQTPDLLGSGFASSLAGRTNAAGVYAFSFEDTGASTPGHHSLHIVVTARLTKVVDTGYDVGIVPT